MTFVLPEKLSEVEDLGALLTDAQAAAAELTAIDEAELTDEQIDELTGLATAIHSINEEQVARDTAASERAEKIAAAKAAVAPVAEEETEEEDPEVPTDELPEIPEGVEVPSDVSTIEQEAPVVAAATPKSVITSVRKPAKTPVPETPARPKAAIIASANVNGFNTGQELTLDTLTQAFMNKISGFPTEKIGEGPAQRYGVAQFKKPIESRFTLDAGDVEGNHAKIDAAIKEQSFGGALVAAGGWCAPSETIYDIPADETVSGILSIPEVNVKRGGIRFTRGPAFSDIYSASGFTQTEAQAIAGTAKNFVDVTCPDFSEVRMDVIGYGVRAAILTNSAWPELVKRYIQGVLVAHAHKVNASKINRIVALAGAQVTAGALGAAVADSLNALDMQAVRLRYKYRLAPNARIEGFAPIWAMSVFKADLAFEEDKDLKSVTDAQVNGWLANRNIYLQWVYDYQDAAVTGVAWPDSVNIVLYPTGTYVAGTTDVISMDAVYDTASLLVNTFTAAFFEEGLMVFSPKLNGVNVRIPLTAAGRVGAHDITKAVPTLT